MGKKPFINRKTAKHYQLVHRSQRDPLINDEDSSSRVFVEVPPSNLRGKVVESSEILGVGESRQKSQEQIESNVGQAALYGVYYDDTEYDYLQHLKPIGAEDVGGAVFIEAPTRKSEKEKREKKKGGDLSFVKDEKIINQKSENTKKEKKVSIVLPEEVLPSKEEISIGYLDRSYIPDDLQGFQPDLDPSLQEVLEALEDEAYVENDLGDEYFAALNADGEYQKSKRILKRNDDDHEGSDLYEDDRKSRTTGYSMSSSVMYRNDKLRLLDEQFEKVEKEYMSDDDSESDDDSVSSLQIRQDFSNILDEFIGKYEVTRHSVFRKGPADDALEENQKLSDQYEVDSIVDRNKSHKPNKDEELVTIESEQSVRKRQAWDCQSILSTYSNLENHPALIREKPSKKIEINQQTGLPIQERKSDEEKSPDNEEDINISEIEIEENEDGQIRG
ncbi:13545_t:CDS:2 [Acaulospora morrowiae]|uniref:13545_t:CDS:1 n=1 Tax=Acaulospora morrowiae TaxID=94023 RepID=A0A9N9FDW9_9GLOM|nr:13545_t:CDS:2 [Acaulospora morrowiae]